MGSVTRSFMWASWTVITCWAFWFFGVVVSVVVSTQLFTVGLQDSFTTKMGGYSFLQWITFTISSLLVIIGGLCLVMTVCPTRGFLESLVKLNGNGVYVLIIVSALLVVTGIVGWIVHCFVAVFSCGRNHWRNLDFYKSLRDGHHVCGSSAQHRPLRLR